MKPKVAILDLKDIRHDARVQRTAAGLAAAGWDVTVLCTMDPGQPPVEETGGYRVLRLILTHTVNHKTRMGRVKAALVHMARFSLRAASKLVRLKPAVIHCNDAETLPTGLACRLWAGSRLLYDAHEMITHNPQMEKAPRPVKLMVLAFERFAAQRCDTMLAVSPHRSRLQKKLLGLKTAPVVIQNAPGLSAVPNPMPRKTGIPSLVYCGAFLKGRAIIESIRAMLLVDDMQLHFYGYGPLKQDMEKLVEKEKLSERVFIHDPVAPDKLPEAAAGHHAGLCIIDPEHVSYRHTLPNKLMEYLAAALPVIANHPTEPAGFTRRFNCGVTINGMSAQNIAEGAKLLFSDAKAVRTMQLNALKAHRDNCWEIQLARLRSVYNRLLTGKE